MNTLGSVTARTFIKGESHTLNIAFEAAEAISAGDAVVLKSDGLLHRNDSASVPSIGFAVMDAAKDEKCTVSTIFSQKMNSIAGAGGVTVGDLVVGLDDSGTVKYRAAGDEEYVNGIALTTADADEAVEIGFLRVPLLTPAGAE